jgi:hypothetical protein
LDYEKPFSTGEKAKNSIGSFLPFSTASTHVRHELEIVAINPDRHPARQAPSPTHRTRCIHGSVFREARPTSELTAQGAFACRN